ncbi:mu-type opioid receptor isoform X1 [Entelurus aequoreus]|uniref:mu-type opioid receptor isoform X1 n=1 Tax=Entelurus aequoreus TaxID=161455 RepID=UPI002B1E3744|nr:mu-type opioid receptor isoform X1 [Entelurus aequoreus]
MQSGSNSVLDLRLHFSWGLLAKQGECPPGVMERKVELEKEREERRTSVFFSASVPNTLRLHHLLIPPAPPPYPLALVHTLRLHHLLIPPAPPPHPACTTSLSPRTCPHTPPAPPPPSPRTSPQAPLSICTSLPGSRRSQAAEEHGERRQRLGWRRSQFDRRLDERQRRGRAVWQHERAGQRHGGALRGRASAERPPGRRGLQPGDDRHRHHGAVLHRVRGGAGGQRARHVHHRQVHQDEDGHQHLHLQPGAGRRPGHQHAALPERQLPDGHLALWGHPVQDGDVHRLLQHVHLHLHAHHHEHRPLRGRLPSRQGSGLQDAAQRQDRQRLQLDPVVRHRPARHLLGLHPCHAIVDCKLLFPPPSWYWDTMLKICVFIFAFIMPVLIITVCYGLMILRLKSVRMLSGSQEKDRNLRRITRMVLVVVAVFIVCWTPIHIFVIITALINIPSSTLQTITWHFCIALGYTNSSLNPVLYGYLDENFKRCFREFCSSSPSLMDLHIHTSSRGGAAGRQVPQRQRNNSTLTGDRSNQQV